MIGAKIKKREREEGEREVRRGKPRE